MIQNHEIVAVSDSVKFIEYICLKPFILQDYELQLASYTSGLETLLNIPIKRTMVQSPSGVILQEVCTSLRISQSQPFLHLHCPCLLPVFPADPEFTPSYRVSTPKGFNSRLCSFSRSHQYWSDFRRQLVEVWICCLYTRILVETGLKFWVQ